MMMMMMMMTMTMMMMMMMMMIMMMKMITIIKTCKAIIIIIIVLYLGFSSYNWLFIKKLIEVIVANYKTEPTRKATRKFTLEIYSDFSGNYENTYLKT